MASRDVAVIIVQRLDEANRKDHPVGETPPPLVRKEGSWIEGRVGMLYRDLVPGDLGHQIGISHIRLPFEGEVPDYVHYHKIDFQLIRCIKGRIKVVYEDQGEPFWLEEGDWVTQPPEIRHRVLECTEGAEVIEITMPREHETFADNEMTLPTAEYLPEREFNGQRFVHHKSHGDHCRSAISVPNESDFCPPQ